MTLIGILRESKLATSEKTIRDVRLFESSRILRCRSLLFAATIQNQTIVSTYSRYSIGSIRAARRFVIRKYVIVFIAVD